MNVYSRPYSPDVFYIDCTTGAAYAAGDLMGAPMPISTPTTERSGLLSNMGLPLSLIVTDAEQQDPELDVIIFADQPTVTGDASPFDPTAADLPKILCRFHVATADWLDFNANSMAQVAPSAPAARVEKKTAWVCVVCQGTPTYTNVRSLSFRIDGLVS